MVPAKPIIKVLTKVQKSCEVYSISKEAKEVVITQEGNIGGITVKFVFIISVYLSKIGEIQ